MKTATQNQVVQPIWLTGYSLWSPDLKGRMGYYQQNTPFRFHIATHNCKSGPFSWASHRVTLT